jgi:hypothetical protein
MTASSGVHLNRVRLHRLLAAVGSTPVPAEVTAEAALYDWRDPHYFDEDQRNRLAAIMSQVAAVLSERCVHFFNSEFEVVPRRSPSTSPRMRLVTRRSSRASP